MLTGDVVRVAPERERPRSVAQPLHVEAGDLLLEPARPEEHVLFRYAAVLEMQLGPLLAAHEARRFADGEAGSAALYEHRPNAAHARTVADINQEQVGFRAVGRKDFASIHH